MGEGTDEEEMKALDDIELRLLHKLDQYLSSYSWVIKDYESRLKRLEIDHSKQIFELTERLEHMEKETLPLVKTGKSLIDSVESMKKFELLLNDDQKGIIRILEEAHPVKLTSTEIRGRLVMGNTTFQRALYGWGGTSACMLKGNLFSKEPRLKIIGDYPKHFFWLEPKKQKPVKYPPVKI